jgi:hypothetical protein
MDRNGYINYKNMVYGTISDFSKHPPRPAFQVCVYGVTMKDITTVGGPIGAKPFYQAIERLGEGLDRCAYPQNGSRDSPQYMATLWELTEDVRKPAWKPISRTKSKPEIY